MSKPQPPNKDDKFFSEFIEVQKQKTLNEAKEIDVRKENLQLQADYAKDSLSKQHDLLKCKPGEDRKTFALFSVIVIIILGLAGLFVLKLIEIGQEELVDKILTWILRIVLIGLSFWIGRISVGKKDKKSENIEEAVEVD